MRKSRIVWATLLMCAVFVAGHQDSSNAASTAYFVVASGVPGFPVFGDSYILPLTDPVDIAVARQLIASGMTRIVNANIAPGADGINRDVLTQVLWSWHVTEFLGFSTLAPEVCDGNPTVVEQAGGVWPGICFWAYTIVQEIPPPVVPVEETTWGRIKDLFKQVP